MSQQSEKCRRLSSILCSKRVKEQLLEEMIGENEQEEIEDEFYQLSLETLPHEVLEMIFKFISFYELASSVRLISRRCSSVATTILNSSFRSSKSRLEIGMKNLSNQAENSNNKHDRSMYTRANDSLELVKAQYELLQAVVWRYTHPPRKQKFDRLCFYAGLILDEINNILRMTKKCPGALYDEDGPAPCIISFAGMCKRFMNFFEKVSERKVNRTTLISGCKPIDLLDCLLEGREVKHLRITSGRGKKRATLHMSLRYIMKRSWFTCLELPSESINNHSKDIIDEDSWRDQQRFMYLRLRRLVGSVNEHKLERIHYERNRLMSNSHDLPIPKPPPCSTYSGYGEYAGRFFYYGNMNEYAFENKVTDTWRRNSLRSRLQKRQPEDKPNYDLEINVELRCSPELAPLAVRSMLKCDDFENLQLAETHKPEIYLKMIINCPASKYNKLPENFVWELKSPRRLKTDS